MGLALNRHNLRVIPPKVKPCTGKGREESVIGGSLTIKCSRLRWTVRHQRTESGAYADADNNGLFFIARGQGIAGLLGGKASAL